LFTCDIWTAGVAETLTDEKSRPSAEKLAEC